MGIAELDEDRHSEMFEERYQAGQKIVKGCETCHGSGWITVEVAYHDDMPFPKSARCDCKRAISHRLKLFDAGVPEELWEADKIDFEFNRHALAQVKRYAGKLKTAKKHGLGLILAGENGTGKSSSAAIVVIEAIRQNMTAAFVSFPDLIRGWEIAKRNTTHRAHLEERSMRDVLVLDELGKEFVNSTKTDEITSKLDSLLRMRRGAFLPTVIVTNSDYSDLVDRYGESIKSLLSVDRFKLLEYDPGDYRSRLKSWDDLLGEEL